METGKKNKKLSTQVQRPFNKSLRVKVIIKIVVTADVSVFLLSIHARITKVILCMILFTYKKDKVGTQLDLILMAVHIAFSFTSPRNKVMGSMKRL